MVAASLWMLVITALLFWLPGGSLIAGLAGGRRAGSLGAAIGAAFLPGMVLCGLLFVFSSFLTGLPLIGALAASGGLLWYCSNVGLLLAGAILGAVLR